MIWKIGRLSLGWGIIFIAIFLSGCRTRILDEKEAVTLEDEIIVDYSTYLKKIWIVEDSTDGDYPISCIFSNITDNVLEGYCSVDQMIFDSYTSQSCAGKEYLPNFHTEIHDGTAEFEIHQSMYGQEDRNENILLTFCEGSRIVARLTEENKIHEYMLRPYNILDWNLSNESMVSGVELDSWGTVNLFYGNSTVSTETTASHHSIPWIFLTDNQGNILYAFKAFYHHGSEILEVAVEDMDGDGLKDVEVVTGVGSSEDAGTRFEWFFFQQEDGRFLQEVCIMKSHNEGVWIRFKTGSFRECSDEYN